KYGSRDTRDPAVGPTTAGSGVKPRNRNGSTARDETTGTAVARARAIPMAGSGSVLATGGGGGGGGIWGGGGGGGGGLGGGGMRGRWHVGGWHHRPAVFRAAVDTGQDFRVGAVRDEAGPADHEVAAVIGGDIVGAQGAGKRVHLHLRPLRRAVGQIGPQEHRQRPLSGRPDDRKIAVGVHRPLRRGPQHDPLPLAPQLTPPSLPPR